VSYPINPYIAGAPLRGERGFFGRQDTLDWVARELRNPATNALVLFGQRRIGKTSLLLRLQHTLPAENFLPIYFDLQDQAVRPVGKVLADLADTVAERVGLLPPIPQAFDDGGRFFHRTFLSQLYRTIGSRRPVFLLDEFDVLDRAAEASLPETAAAKALIPFLRRVMNEDPRPAFVFAIGRRAEDLSLDSTATFKASLVREIWVLDRQSAEALTRQAEANRTLRFSERAVERILAQTNCHPYLTQLLCQRIWERAYIGNPPTPPLVDTPQVEEAIADTLQVGNQALVWLWNGMSPAERVYAAALAQISDEGQIIPEDRVIETLTTHAARLRSREIELAPRDLVGRRVLEQVGEHEYRFAIELFRRWVRQNKPLRDVKEELDRVEPVASRLYELGKELFDQRCWHTAIRYFRDALEVNPRHFRARLNLGESLLELGQNDLAVSELEQAYELDSHEARLPLARALVAQAHSRELAGDAEGALAACERALAISPGERAAQQLRALIWKRWGDEAWQSHDMETARTAYLTAGDVESAAQVEQLLAAAVPTGGGEPGFRSAHQSPPELLQAYYLALANECRQLPLEVIEAQFASVTDGLAPSLPDTYVDLDAVALEEGEECSEHTWALHLPKGRGRLALLTALTRRKSAHLILLGPPGSGKTSFVNHLAFLMATHSVALPKSLSGRLMMLLSLRQVAAHYVPSNAQGSASMLWDALRDDIAARLDVAAARDLFPHLQERLLKEGGLILLDGLDQVPQAARRRQAVLEAIQELIASLPKNSSYVLITSRPHACAEDLSRLSDFALWGLTPFDGAQVERFIRCWYQAARAPMGWDEAEARAKSQRLQAALKEWPVLADLASRPLLLAAMAAFCSGQRQLPQDRAALYEQVVRLLLWSWQRARECEASVEPLDPGAVQVRELGEARLRALVESAALAVHRRQQEEWGRDETTADISIGEIADICEPDIDPTAMLEYLQDAGLMTGRAQDIYAFSHRAFQEYLAACCLTRSPDFDEMQRLIHEDPIWWREVVLLALGAARQGHLDEAIRVLDVLLPENPQDAPEIDLTHWRIAALVGRALQDLHLVEAAGEQSRCVPLVERARRWLVRLVEEGQLDWRERAEAGDVLGWLGDPRFDTDLCLPRYYRGAAEPFLGFVEIPAGPFVMGSQKGDKGVSENEFGNESPQIPYTYWIARYPVTVAQFRAFVDDGGYEEPVWWTESGWAWRNGQSNSRPAGSGQGGESRRARSSHLNPEPISRPVELRAAPMWWDEQCRYPNHPVYGVSWFEAMAYCRWLDARLRETRSDASIPPGCLVRLPTEAEWEKAARSGDRRRYPWGDQNWDAQRASIPGRMARLTPVGMYPQGATPLGLHDMSGNVWEWTLSLYRPYPYRHDDGRNAWDAEGERVIRGGAWIGIQRVARCAYRGSRAPDDCGEEFIGFRLAVSCS